MNTDHAGKELGRGIRVGAVSYLNTKPLIDGLQDDLGVDDNILLDLPSRLADRLGRGELDVALIPSIEFFQKPEYSILSDACIACCGPVWSVKLLFRVPPHAVKTLALDEGSRTSAALSKILLNERFSIRPDSVPIPIDADPYLNPADAILVIGDRAMKPVMDGFVEEWDLGEEWFLTTGLPFVFAMWVCRPGRLPVGLELALSTARDRGVSEAKTLARRYASSYHLTEEDCERYFTHFLQFHLGSHELMGLQLFYEKAVQLGLAQPGRSADSFRLVNS